MVRTQIQFPYPLYRRLNEVAERHDWPLAEVVRRAAELYVQRFADGATVGTGWDFPTLELEQDYLTDPAALNVEQDVVDERSR